MNREPQIILAVGDGRRMRGKPKLNNGQQVSADIEKEGQWEGVLEELETTRKASRRAILARLFVFEGDFASTGSNSQVTFVPAPGESNSTTMKTVMCDLASIFLSRLSDLAKEIQDLPVLESPWKQRSSGSRSDSSTRVQQRMTMPVRSASGREGQDVVTGSNTNSVRSLEASRSRTPTGARPTSQLVSREQSRDRMSSPSQGSTPALDRKQLKTSGRLSVVLGGLYLQAGHWQEALKEIEKGLTACRGMSDYLWHGRALELMIACVVLSGWAGIPFQIPQACYPNPEKPLDAKQTPGSHIATDVSDSLRDLAQILPDIFSTIMKLYSRSANFTQEQLPQVMFFEANLRMVNASSALRHRGGALDPAALSFLMDGRQLSLLDTVSSVGYPGSRRQDISAMLNQTLTFKLEDLSHDEAVYVLNSLVSCLSLIGLHRKQAFLIRELIAIIIPTLIHARKVGAAEIGIHPAAGLSSLVSPASNRHSSAQKTDRDGLRPLLKTLMDIYGIDSASREGSYSPFLSITEKSRSMNLGDVTLKVDVLRACLNVCEALPDLEGVVSFSVQMLQLTKGTILMPEPHTTGGPLISQDEQMRLINLIKRTVDAASRFGLSDLEADYWDEFLVRNIEIVESISNTSLRSHTKHDLDLVGTSNESKPKDPFIFNPFAKASSSKNEQTTLVAGEAIWFQVTLQNPFDFDIEVDSMKLDIEGCDFTANNQSLLLGAFCLQKVMLSGTPNASGDLIIKGVVAKLRGCRQKQFSTFKAKPKTDETQKSKTIGSLAETLASERPASTESANLAKKVSYLIHESILRLKVIEPQPSLKLSNSSLSQLALMVIEGESKTIEITLENMSKSAPVDFLLFTFQDSATKQVQSALSNRELSTGDMYDLQLMLLENPTLRLKSQPDPSIKIVPGESKTFLLEVVGRAGLLESTIQVDYAYLGKDKSDVSSKFHTRQLTIPLRVTVNAGLELVRCNIVPFSGDFAWGNQQLSLQESTMSEKAISLSPPGQSGSRSRAVSTSSSRSSTRKAGNQFASLLSRLGVGMYGDDHCLLMLDMRNVWPHPLTITIQVREQLPKSSSADPWSRAYSVHEIVQPGHTSRSVLLLPRVFIQNPYEAIPTIGNARQFVVSMSKISPEAERANREIFWFREELLKHVRGTWSEDSTGRQGFIDLRRAFRFNTRMVDALRVQDVDISMEVRAISDGCSAHGIDEIIHQTGRSKFSLRTNEFATLRVTVHNRTTSSIPLVVRLQPSLRDQPHTVALDLVRRFAWTGMLQQTLHPPVGVGEKREFELGIMALCEGAYEIGATAEELLSIEKPETILEGSSRRRIWHARELCTIDAVEEDLFDA